uniref:MET transcriptional regulator MACC1 n=1 Tax=Gasterosteus aculeatus aculeatus TaxID=481459 RepID=A0AAQ4RZ47_GASAC
MAWLSHRQLTRSCLDLNLMSQSPGWAQTQATGYQVTCKVGHAGGSVQLPASKISIHLPEGHVPPGEVQEVTLKAKLDPPPGLNNNYMTTMSPLLEVVLSNINIKEGIALEMKLAGEVKSDPLSQVPSPPAAPIRAEKRVPRLTEKQIEMPRSPPITEESASDSLKFTDRPVNLQCYGVALKSVFRQPRVDYLLEYFKGDTVALLSRETVKSVGNSKVKEWYIGFLRGRTGLVHCRNVKLITADQVIDFTGVRVSTEVLLDNMTLPFKKLTYMYSAIQTLVTEHITSWRGLADALGYSELPLDTITRTHAETEADKVACVLEKLKEDCHADKSKKKFLHELMVGLLKMDSVNLVARLIQNTVILSTAVELGARWRELAEKTDKLSSAQIAGYEAPHRGKSKEVGAQAMWKPAYDFLYSWSLRYGDSYRDMIQDLHLVLDKMKNPATRQWRQLTGALITANCLDIFRASAYPNS